MLVLSRKVGQSLVIADGVIVTVSEIGPDFVRLTVEAPNEAEVRRRYPQSLEVPETPNSSERPIVVTLTLHDAAVLDRLRRRMSEEESLPPSRDAALSAMLHAVAENDDFQLPRISGGEAATHAANMASAAAAAQKNAARRRPTVAAGKPR